MKSREGTIEPAWSKELLQSAMESKRKEIEEAFQMKIKQVHQRINEEEQKMIANLKSLFQSQQQKFMEEHLIQKSFGRENTQEYLVQVREGLKLVEEAKNLEEIA